MLRRSRHGARVDFQSNSKPWRACFPFSAGARFHDLRGTTATLLARSGVGLVVAPAHPPAQRSPPHREHLQPRGPGGPAGGHRPDCYPPAAQAAPP